MNRQHTGGPWTSPAPSGSSSRNAGIVAKIFPALTVHRTPVQKARTLQPADDGLRDR